MAWLVTMAETPKKLLNVNTSAFCATQSSAGRVRIFRKSAVELRRLIEMAICENISKHRNSGSELFICNAKCYKRLQRLEKAKKNMESTKEEICGIYQSINRREKWQRADQVVEIGDKNITHLTTTKRASAAKSLKLTGQLITSSTTAEHVATTCTSYSCPTAFFRNPLAWTSPQYSGAELVRQAFSAPLSTSTPVSTQPVGKLTKISLYPFTNSEIAFIWNAFNREILNFERTVLTALSRSFVSTMLFYLVHLHSREKRPAVKVNLLDVSRFNVIG